MMLGEPETRALIAVADAARRAAYAPYSRFTVGAAVVAADDRVFAGCNVESASYGLSLCAERAAIAAAVASGARRIRAIVIVTDSASPATPCGACRQWLAELADEDSEVVCATLSGQRARHHVRDLLPHPFGLRSP